MIMPANYSVIAENELSYVDGGVAPMTSLKILDKNIVEAVGKLYAPKVLNAFIGNWFITDDGDQSILKLIGNGIKGLFNAGVSTQGTVWGKALRGVTNTIGVLGGIYVLGMYDDAVLVDKNDGYKDFAVGSWN